MSDLTVAKTILQQLGGNRFRMMTGAKSFAGSANSLTFRLPGGGGYCQDGINAVSVTLNSMDTYDMKFSRLRGAKLKVICEYNGVYCDQLQEMVTSATGLVTHL